MQFIDRDVSAGGPACLPGEGEFAQLVRGRIKMEVNYSYDAGQWRT